MTEESKPSSSPSLIVGKSNPVTEKSTTTLTVANDDKPIPALELHQQLSPPGLQLSDDRQDDTDDDLGGTIKQEVEKYTHRLLEELEYVPTDDIKKAIEAAILNFVKVYRNFCILEEEEVKAQITELVQQVKAGDLTREQMTKKIGEIKLSTDEKEALRKSLEEQQKVIEKGNQPTVQSPPNPPNQGGAQNLASALDKVTNGLNAESQTAQDISRNGSSSSIPITPLLQQQLANNGSTLQSIIDKTNVAQPVGQDPSNASSQHSIRRSSLSPPSPPAK